MFNSKIKAIPHMILGVFLLVLLVLKSKHLRIAIKVWSLISVIGGLLVVLSIILFLLGGAPEKIKPDVTIISIAHILIGGYFYSYCDQAIKNVPIANHQA